MDRFRAAGMVMAVGLVVFVAAQVAAALHVSGNTDWRPCSTTYKTLDAMPQDLNWSEGFDSSGVQYFCLHPDDTVNPLEGQRYVGNATLYVMHDLVRNLRGQLTRTGFPGVHASDIQYVQPKPVGHKSEGVYIEFDYYIPFYQDTSECARVKQYVLIGNADANFSEGSGSFDDAFYELNRSEKACGEWHHFRHHANEFTNDFGSAFSHNSKSIGAMEFEVANMYIENVTINGQNMTRVW